MSAKFDFSTDRDLGQQVHDLGRKLWPLNRSLTGTGVRQTFDMLAQEIPGLIRHSLASGTQIFDWTIPQEWSVIEAYIVAPDGQKICDFKQNNLHLVGYSQPIQAVVTLDELQGHLFSLPDQPDAIPYVTSYYAPMWGFCLTDNQRKSLTPGDYEVVIKSEHFDGQLDYADVVIPGESDQEIVFSTYICHPSMANNELSGPLLATALAKMIAAEPNRKLSYRFVFVPETIGALVYIHENFDHLKTHTAAGYVLTCVGDERAWSYLPSRWGDTLSDRAALAALHDLQKEFDTYPFTQRGSDERQYCSPGVDLPFCSVMRSKYATFPEYHTSLDDLDFVTPKGLCDSIETYRHIIRILDANACYSSTVIGEPQLGKRGLYSTVSRVGSQTNARILLNVLMYSDGQTDLIDLAEKTGHSTQEVIAAMDLLRTHGLIAEVA